LQCDVTLSGLMPSTTVSIASKRECASRNSRASIVQPGVSSFG
jgi:hypothetical protein